MTSTVYRFGLRFFGDASALRKSAKEAEDALKATGARGTAEAKRTEEAIKASGTRTVSETRRSAEARKVLNVRSEREVQREIERTQAAYNRLTRSGTMSWREQRVATRAMREEVTKLTNELGRLTARQTAAMGARGVAAVGTGVGVTTALMAPKVQRELDFDTRMRYLANTAYNDEDGAGRNRGLERLRREVIETVRASNLRRDGVVGIAEELYGSGRFGPAEVAKLMREVALAGTANNADPAAFAQMAISANQSMGLKPEQMRRMFGMATYGGQVGGFEVKDMARYLPEQMGMAGSLLGMRGEAGFAKLVALNQAAVATAGTRDQAGNNVVNLLGKMGAEDTVKDFAKRGIDLRKEYAEGAVRGLDAVDVLGNLLEKQFAKDANLQKARQQLLKAEPGGKREAALNTVVDVAKGANIAKVFQDRQALAALLGYLGDRERVSRIAREAPLRGELAMDRNLAFVSEGAGFKVQRAKNEAEIATEYSIGKLAPAIGGLADGVSDVVKKYPGYSFAITTATAAIASMGVTAALLAKMGGGGAGLGLGALLGGAAGAAKSAGAVGLAGAAGYGLGTLAYKGLLEGNAAGNMIGRGIAGGLSFFGNREASEALRLEGALGADNMPARSASDRLGRTSGALPLLQQDLKGEINLRITSAPGLQVQAETRSNNPRIPFRADTGRTNLNTGF